MYLSRNDKARVMHLYKLSPYLSAKSIAKNLNLKWKAVFEFLVSKGYSPEMQEKNRQKALYANANKLLEEAIKAGEEGRMEDYLRLRKEYDIASRQAKAYKMRGALSATDKTIYGLESQYQTLI